MDEDDPTFVAQPAEDVEVRVSRTDADPLARASHGDDVSRVSRTRRG